MVHFDRIAASLLVALVISSCGPTAIALPTNPPASQPTSPTGQPTTSATGQATPIADATASAAPETITPPTQTAPPAQSPAAATPSATAPTPSVQPTQTVVAWRDRADIADGPPAREDHTWTIVSLADDIAYLFGGRDAAGPSAELWEFNLATDAWSLLEPSGAAPAARFGHTATWVPLVGLVVWSGQGASGFFDDIWAYDPATNAWRELQSLGAVPAARYGSCAALGPDGELWISHGFTEESGRFADTRSYAFTSGSWTDRTPFDSVPVERCLHDCFWSIGDQLILYGGQTTGVAALGDVWAYDYATGTWARGPDPAMPPRQLYSLSTAAGTGLVFGGGTLDGGFLDDTWLIGADLSPVPFEQTSVRPPGRSGAALIADTARQRDLLFGGRNADGLLGDLWELSH